MSAFGTLPAYLLACLLSDACGGRNLSVLSADSLSRLSCFLTNKQQPPSSDDGRAPPCEAHTWTVTRAVGREQRQGAPGGRDDQAGQVQQAEDGSGLPSLQGEAGSGVRGQQRRRQEGEGAGR